MKAPISIGFIEELEAYGNELGSEIINNPKKGIVTYYDYEGWYEVVEYEDGFLECNQLQEQPVIDKPLFE